MKLINALVFCVLVFPLFAAAEQPDTPETMEAYYQELQQGCKEDTDCEIKDIGNCCGNMPGCVLKEKTPDLFVLKSICKREQVMGICGFKPVSTCICENGRCKEQL